MSRLRSRSRGAEPFVVAVGHGPNPVDELEQTAGQISKTDQNVRTITPATRPKPAVKIASTRSSVECTFSSACPSTDVPYLSGLNRSLASLIWVPSNGTLRAPGRGEALSAMGRLGAHTESPRVYSLTDQARTNTARIHGRRAPRQKAARTRQHREAAGGCSGLREPARCTPRFRRRTPAQNQQR
jgi:hypothetical protein